MTHAAPRAAFPGLKIWHLGLLVLFVALALWNVQDQGMTEPPLLALAAAGFVAYGAIGGVGWRLSGRLEGRLGRAGRLALFAAGMGALFLAATGVYLALEFRYRNGVWF